MFTKFPAFVAGNVAWNTRIRFVTHAPTKFPPVFKVIPQFCIVHSFCAYFNNKSLRNIFKMAAIQLQKNKSERARNGRFSELKRVSKNKKGVKFEINSWVKVLTK